MPRKKKKVTIKVKETARQKAKRQRGAVRKAGATIHRPTKAHEPKTRYKRSRAKQQLRRQLKEDQSWSSWQKKVPDFISGINCFKLKMKNEKGKTTRKS